MKDRAHVTLRRLDLIPERELLNRPSVELDDIRICLGSLDATSPLQGHTQLELAIPNQRCVRLGLTRTLTARRIATLLRQVTTPLDLEQSSLPHVLPARLRRTLDTRSA